MRTFTPTTSASPIFGAASAEGCGGGELLEGVRYLIGLEFGRIADGKLLKVRPLVRPAGFVPLDYGLKPG